jgi:histone acetyltransferase (RNA polymerase elongator complex component)
MISLGTSWTSIPDKTDHRTTQCRPTVFRLPHFVPPSTNHTMQWSQLNDMEDLGDMSLHDGFDTKKQFQKVVSKLKAKHKNICKNSELYRVYKLLEASGSVQHHPQLGFFLRTKVGKSSSGILSVTVFTSPYPQFVDPTTGKLKTQRFSCKWNCYYCPDHKDMPRSYLPDEPGCLRAERLHFIAADQLTERVETLRRIGHPVDKLEVLVLGGTWESYPLAYRAEFVRDLFWAANTFFDPVGQKRGVRSLKEEQRINETTQVKIIGLTLETRPDTISKATIRLLRTYGCTRVQLGVQHLDDGILKLCNRGHGKQATVTALKLLKDACFKVDIHIMPDLPGTTPDMDREMFGQFLNVTSVKTTTDATTSSMKHYGGGEGEGGRGGYDHNDHNDHIENVLETNITPPASWANDGDTQYYEYELEGPDVQADQWKIYPCEVTPWTVIEKWFNEGTYVPYGGGDSPELRSIIIDANILGGNANVNLRQMLQNQMKKDGDVCHCIRCREVGLNSWSNQASGNARLVVRKYNASEGIEYFLSYESPDERLLYGFVRLRISESAGIDEFESLKNSALIRELHVYGQLIPTYHKNDGGAMGKKGGHGGKVQHAGFGSKLMRKAEVIAMSHGMYKMAVIAGVGTRDYYRKLGYHYDDDGGFLVKVLDSKTTDWITFAVAAIGIVLCAMVVMNEGGFSVVL